MALTVKESLKTPTHTYSLMGTDQPTHLHINNRVTDGNSVMVPRDEVIAACRITAADVPESVKRGIQAEGLEELAFSVGLFWVRNMFGGADPGQILARVREFFRKQAAKLREQKDD